MFRLTFRCFLLSRMNALYHHDYFYHGFYRIAAGRRAMRACSHRFHDIITTRLSPSVR